MKVGRSILFSYNWSNIKLYNLRHISISKSVHFLLSFLLNSPKSIKKKKRKIYLLKIPPPNETLLQGNLSSRPAKIELPLLSNRQLLLLQLTLSKIKNRTTLRPPLNSASSWKLVESWKEASNFTGVRQLGQVIIFTGSGTRPTTSKLKPFFPVPRTARSCGNPRRRTRPACKHGTLLLVSMVTYTSPPPLLARRTWHGAGDAGFHPSVRAQRRGGSRAAQTFVPVDPGRVILSLDNFFRFTDRVSIVVSVSNGKTGGEERSGFGRWFSSRFLEKLQLRNREASSVRSAEGGSVTLSW